MSKPTDYLRWVMQCGKERRYAGEDYFWAVLESAIADVDERMVELPLDADDVPIRVGDTMRCTMGDYEYEVLGVGEQCFFAWNTDGGRLAQIDARNFAHRKRTLEDVRGDKEWKLDYRILDGIAATQTSEGKTVVTYTYLEQLNRTLEAAARILEMAPTGQALRTVNRAIEMVLDVGARTRLVADKLSGGKE